MNVGGNRSRVSEERRQLALHGKRIRRSAETQNSGRVTAIEPLPEAVLERIYAEKDELQDYYHSPN